MIYVWCKQFIHLGIPVGKCGEKSEEMTVKQYLGSIEYDESYVIEGTQRKVKVMFSRDNGRSLIKKVSTAARVWMGGFPW